MNGFLMILNPKKFTKNQYNSNNTQHITKIFTNSKRDEICKTKEIIEEKISEIPMSYSLPVHNQKLDSLASKLFIN